MSRDGVIAWRREGPVGTAIIDRPERRNALSARLCDDLRSLLVENMDLRAMVIGGSGDRAFCAGADLVIRTEDAGGLTPGGGDSFRPAFERLLDEIVAFPAPVIAAVNGAALGAGMQLAVACDLRVTAPRATFGIPAGRLGVMISAVNVQRLVRVVGQAMAQDLLLTARVLTAAEARTVGLVQRDADQDAIADAQQLAAEVAALAPMSATAHKAVLRTIGHAGGITEEDGLAFAELEAAAFASEDLREGLAAFSEKRTPRFSGR